LKPVLPREFVENRRGPNIALSGLRQQIDGAAALLFEKGAVLGGVAAAGGRDDQRGRRANEELFYVIAGEGVVRIGDESYPVHAGDVIVCPAGGPETAHHLLNISASEELRYLAISTMLRPEISEYPDSQKFATFVEPVPGAPERSDRFVGRRSRADYWDGE